MSPEALLAELPLVAILRGVTPSRIEGVASALVAAGIRIIEVPLNSPEPFASIEKLAAKFGDSCLTGAGTVIHTADIDQVVRAGGRLVVSPHTDARLIAHAIAKALRVMPGMMTPSEAFTALAAGARHLKLFPASACGPGHLKAMRVVLPSDAKLYAVGGVHSGNMKEWRQAGAAGFGLGSDLFKPEYSDSEIARRAREAVAAFRAAG